VRETGLQLVIADLLISRAARPACAAGADEGYCDSITDLPTNDVFALGSDLAGKLVPRNVRHANIRVMPHPSVPITSAKTSRFDSDHHAIIGGHRIVDILNAQRLSELVVDRGFHDGSSYPARRIRGCKGMRTTWAGAPLHAVDHPELCSTGSLVRFEHQTVEVMERVFRPS